MKQEDYYGYESISYFSGEKVGDVWTVKNTLVQRRRGKDSDWEEKSIEFSSSNSDLDSAFYDTYVTMGEFLSSTDGTLFDIDLETAGKRFEAAKSKKFERVVGSDNNILQ